MVSVPKVLVVEDSAEIREMLSRLLTMRGFEVTVASDGEEGLQQYEAHRPDLIVTDLRMPRADGLNLAESVRQTGDQIPMVLLTAYGLDDERSRQFAKLPNTRALSKADVGQLVPTLEMLLGTNGELKKPSPR